jgi:hypothetical protein
MIPMPIEHLDDFNEALEIIEGDSYKDIERRHLEAAVEMVEAREATILTMRELLNETRSMLSSLDFNGRLALLNRAANTLATTWPERDLVA